MVKLKSFDLQILQNAATANEYLDPKIEDIDNSVTRYVEIKEDQNFAIELTVQPNLDLADFDALCMYISFDGKFAGGQTFSKRQCVSNKVFKYSMASLGKLIDGRHIDRAFYFKETTTRWLRQGDDEDQLRQQYEKQGEIRIELLRVCGYSSKQDQDDQPDKVEEIYPKSVVKEKGSTSKASYVETERKGPRSVFIMTEEEDVMTEFTFKYRTIEALQDQQTVAPVPLIKFPNETFTDTELRDEIERLKAENANLRTKIKQEEANDYRDATRRKRKYLEMSGEAEVDVLEERRAGGRGPTDGDVVIELDD